MDAKVRVEEASGGRLGAVSEFMSKVSTWVLELKFDPDEPASVEGAVETMSKGVDALAASYAGNSVVQAIAGQMKTKYEVAIREARPEDLENWPAAEE